jgi:hypothetical protein
MENIHDCHNHHDRIFKYRPGNETEDEGVTMTRGRPSKTPSTTTVSPTATAGEGVRVNVGARMHGMWR